MSTTLVEALAEFATDVRLDDIPEDVIEDCKRVLLDSVGCGIAGLGVQKGRAGVDVGRVIGGPGGEATIFGTPHRTSVFGAAFANGESINALDYDSVLPPGHVAPYVLPGALAVAEISGASGKELITAIAVSHEMSSRFGRAMDYIRDTKDGVVSWAPVLGYTST